MIGLAAVPLLFMPGLYRVLSEWVAAEAGLVCPECNRPIASGEDWRICLDTRMCPHCGRVIVAGTSVPEPKTKRLNRRARG